MEEGASPITATVTSQIKHQQQPEQKGRWRRLEEEWWPHWWRKAPTGRREAFTDDADGAKQLQLQANQGRRGKLFWCCLPNRWVSQVMVRTNLTFGAAEDTERMGFFNTEGRWWWLIEVKPGGRGEFSRWRRWTASASTTPTSTATSERDVLVMLQGGEATWR